MISSRTWNANLSGGRLALTAGANTLSRSAHNLNQGGQNTVEGVRTRTEGMQNPGAGAPTRSEGANTLAHVLSVPSLLAHSIALKIRYLRRKRRFLALAGCDALSAVRRANVSVEWRAKRVHSNALFAHQFSSFSICPQAFKNTVKSRSAFEYRSRATSSWSALAKPRVSQHRCVFVTRR